MNGNRFVYQAHGMALGGRITQPFQAEIDGQAATSLSSIGGYSSSKAEKFTLNDLIKYESAHSYVSGVQTNDGPKPEDVVYNTLITSITEGLNILHVVTADAIVCKLSAKQGPKGQPDITPIGSEFHNLKIAGQPVQVDLDHARFAKNPTYDALVKYHADEKNSPAAQKIKPAEKLRYQWGLDSDEIPSGLQKGMLVPPAAGFRQLGGKLHTSMVKAVRPVGPGNTLLQERPYGYAIHIPHVGNLYLAEMYATGDSKRLCMLRLELGCPITGIVLCSEGVGNGSWG